MNSPSPSLHDQRRREYQRRLNQTATPQDSSPHRVYELLRAAMRDGSIGTRDQLVEHLLVGTYGASRNSVRQALQTLADQGLLRRERRTGTNLAHEIVPIPVGEVGPRAWIGTAHQGRLQVRTIECTRIPAGPALQERLQYEGDHVILLEQTGMFDGEPLYHRTAFLAVDLTPAELMSRVESIHRNDFPPMPVAFEVVMEEQYGGSTYSVEAVAADDRIAAALDIPVGIPTMLRELVTLGISGRPRELSFTYFRPGHATLSSAGEILHQTTAEAIELLRRGEVDEHREP